MVHQIISCPRCMKTVKMQINNGGDTIRNQKCWHCYEQLS